MLKSGEQINGEILREVDGHLTIRTSTGVLTYALDAFAPDWLNARQEATQKRQKEISDAKTEHLKSTLKEMVGNESLSRASPFISQNKQLLLPICAGLSAIGLGLCFFGWKWFKFCTVLGGILAGALMGLVFSVIIVSAVGSIFPESKAAWIIPGLFILLVIPFTLLGAKVGRRFAMFNARTQTLAGLGSGMTDSMFALSRFAFFDLSIIWGHALIGSLLLISGSYVLALLLLSLPTAYLQFALVGSLVFSILMCIIGVISQIKQLRSVPKNTYQGEY